MRMLRIIHIFVVIILSFQSIFMSLSLAQPMPIKAPIRNPSGFTPQIRVAPVFGSEAPGIPSGSEALPKVDLKEGSTALPSFKQRKLYGVYDHEYRIIEGSDCELIILGLRTREYKILIPVEIKEQFDQITSEHKQNMKISVPAVLSLCGCKFNFDCNASPIINFARQVKLTPDQLRALGRHTYIFIKDPSLFSELYNRLYISTKHLEPPEFRAFHPDAKIRSRSPPPPQLPPTVPPYPPIPANSSGNNDNSFDKNEGCEFEPAVCINPSTGDMNAEIEMKCPNLPSIKISTDFKLSISLGKYEVSFEKKKGEKE